MNGERPDFDWGRIARLGLVQAALGAIVVLTTSTLNRVMVVELALPALLPGLLVALHYAVQVTRPGMGHGTDVTGRHTPWIVGGMAVLGTGGVAAAAAVVWMASDRAAGIALAVLAFTLIGLGVSAGGTSLLVLLAKRVAPARRAAAATIVWMMMIAGFAVTAGVAGQWLDPYSPARLLAVTAVVSALAFAVTLVALYRLEGGPATAAVHRALAMAPMAAGVAVSADSPSAARPAAPPARASFSAALAQVWDEPAARRFTVFIFISMLAYSAQDLILEPFAGSVFGLTPGQSTQLSGVQHGGVLLGMLVVAFACGSFGMRLGGARFGSLRGWTVGGCLASALALAALSALGALAATGIVAPAGLLKAAVFALGVANGAFSIAAIASMMRLAGVGHASREGVRMGLWGAAQAVAFGLGGVVGTGASDLAQWLIGRNGSAYATVFALEALLFVGSALLASNLDRPRPAGGRPLHAADFSDGRERPALQPR